MCCHQSSNRKFSRKPNPLSPRGSLQLTLHIKLEWSVSVIIIMTNRRRNIWLNLALFFCEPELIIIREKTQGYLKFWWIFLQVMTGISKHSHTQIGEEKVIYLWHAAKMSSNLIVWVKLTQIHVYAHVVKTQAWLLDCEGPLRALLSIPSLVRRFKPKLRDKRKHTWPWNSAMCEIL